MELVFDCLKMFIIVRFGGTVAYLVIIIIFSSADEEELFNPDCAMRIFVEDVKKRCNCVEKGTPLPSKALMIKSSRQHWFYG